MKTYDAIATRNEGWWSVEIPSVGGGIFTQGRSLTDAERMARDAIASVLDVPIDAVSVTLQVREAGLAPGQNSYVRWEDIRAEHVARAGGEQAVEAGKQELLAEVLGFDDGDIA